MSDLASMAAGFVGFFFLLGVLLTILWTAVPFFVFSMHRRLGETNRHLLELQKVLKESVESQDRAVAGLRKEIRRTNEILAAAHHLELTDESAK